MSANGATRKWKGERINRLMCQILYVLIKQHIEQIFNLLGWK